MKAPQAAWKGRRRRRPTLRPGSRGPEVEALQQRLARLGFYEGEVDGTYGELTEDAVRTFQRAFRLHADGVAGPELFRLLDDPLLAMADGRVEQLLVGWAESAEEAQRGPAWLSGWTVPFDELPVDRLGRPDLRHVENDRPPVSAADAGAPPIVPVVTLRPESGIARLHDHDAGRWLARLRRAAPLARVVVAAADLSAHPGRPEAAELPPPGAGWLVRRLRRAGLACWLSLRIRAASRRSSLLWWGYEVARRTHAFERLIVWVPGPDVDLDATLTAVRAAVRGIRRWRLPWQVLLGLDLAPWLIDPAGGQDGRGPARRRLTRAEAVKMAWQLRLRRLRGEPPEQLPMLVRCTADRVRALARLVRWAGLGGMVLHGLDRAEQPALTELAGGFHILRFSSEDEAS